MQIESDHYKGCQPHILRNNIQIRSSEESNKLVDGKWKFFPGYRRPKVEYIKQSCLIEGD